MLPKLPARELPRLLGVLGPTCPDTLAAPILEFATRHSAGNEEEIAKAGATAAPEVRTKILELLAAAGTDAARAALSRLADGADPALRVELRILMAGDPNQLQKEIAEVFEQGSAAVRAAALRSLVKQACARRGPR